MSTKKFKAGFIGAGNMGGVLASAAVKATSGNDVAVCCHTYEFGEERANAIGCRHETLDDIVRGSEYLFFGFKPQGLDGIVPSVLDSMKKRDSEPVIVSMLAGVSIDKLETRLGSERKIIRIMPNTPASVGEGVMLVCKNVNVSEEELTVFKTMMASTGLVADIAEEKIDAASALSGCGPAYVYLFIEALADGAVRCGLARDAAYSYAAQTLIGASRLFLESGKSPSELKDAVCSPGGSTIDGVLALEDGAFRATAMRAVIAAYEKTKKLG